VPLHFDGGFVLPKHAIEYQQDIDQADDPALETQIQAGQVSKIRVNIMGYFHGEAFIDYQVASVRKIVLVVCGFRTAFFISLFL
jgi:hypothetical protein